MQRRQREDILLEGTVRVQRPKTVFEFNFLILVWLVSGKERLDTSEVLQVYCKYSTWYLTI